MSADRFVLHSGIPGWRKAFAGCFSIFGLLACAALSLIMVSVEVPGVLNWIFAPIASLSGIFFVATPVFLLRHAAWLEGTTLVVRGGLTTRRCDLATAAHISVDSVSEYRTGRRVPRLCVWTASTNRWLRLRLYSPATLRLLEPPKLHALANAIQCGHRAWHEAMAAEQIAQGLRAMADDPLREIR